MRRNNTAVFKNTVKKRDESGSKQLLTDGGVDVSSTSRPWQDAETLRHLYEGRGLTTREIGDILGCSNGTVSRWLDRHGISARDNWTEGADAAKRANRLERVECRTLESGYQYWGSKEWRPGDDSRTTEIVYVHRLLAVAEFGFDAVCGRDVHHKNGVPWDNRPENIELMDKEEHGRHHAEERWKGEPVTDGGITIESEFLVKATQLEDVSVSTEDDRFIATVREPAEGVIDVSPVVDLANECGHSIASVIADIEKPEVTVEVER